ncbi:MAG TPA: alpha/beta hydrolase [Acidimicrobiales bacterium]
MGLTDEDYDEFAHLESVATRRNINWSGAPKVRRRSFQNGSGLLISALQWGESDPEFVFFHGRGQNAHTWDTVILSLDRPSLAIDLPGHGRSSWRDDSDYRAEHIAPDLAVALEIGTAPPITLIGMSLGGLAAIRLTADRPDLIRGIGIVDVTPHFIPRRRPPGAELRVPAQLLAGGPVVYDTFDELVASVMAVIPSRSKASLEVSVRHNSMRLEDGTWTWSYDRRPAQPSDGPPSGATLWDDLSSIHAPMFLAVGGTSDHVVEEELEEFRRRQPSAHVDVVAGAGHSIQSDRPIELANLIGELGKS